MLYDVHFRIERAVEVLDFLVHKPLYVRGLGLHEILQIRHFADYVVVHGVYGVLRVLRILVEVLRSLAFECLVGLGLLLVGGRNRLLAKLLVPCLNLGELLGQDFADGLKRLSVSGDIVAKLFRCALRGHQGLGEMVFQFVRAGVEKADHLVRLLRVLSVEGSRLLADLGIHLSDSLVDVLLKRGELRVVRVHEALGLFFEQIFQRLRSALEFLGDVVRPLLDCLLGRAQAHRQLLFEFLRGHVHAAQVVLVP